MLNEDLQRDVDRLLDGDLSDTEKARVLAEVESDPEAVEWLAQRSLMHARLRRSLQRQGLGETAQDQLALDAKPAEGRDHRGWKVMAVVASVAALLLFLTLLFRGPSQGTATDTTFATLTESKAAIWESGSLPTAPGSRLDTGTLRLAEGLATVTFDSGAEVVLEARTSLTLLSSMSCRLTQGTAVSDIPDSALGFRIETPAADVVDHGTRFAVSVFEGSGETHTHVLEGRVEVKDKISGKVVELRTGQRNTVTPDVSGAAVEASGSEVRTIPLEELEAGPDWTFLEPSKDAYTGFVTGHQSDVLLLLKSAVEDQKASRTAYVGYSLSEVNRGDVTSAELRLHFVPTGWGLASLVPDATFSVYGMTGKETPWDESILHDEFPGQAEWTRLGSVVVPQGVQRGRFAIQDPRLATFVRESGTDAISFKIARDTPESTQGGLVHSIASRRHPFLPAPTLALRFDPSKP